MKRSTKCQSRIDDIFYFAPHNSKFGLKKINTYESQDFAAILKTGIYVIKLHTSKKYTKFQSNIFVLVVQCPKY